MTASMTLKTFSPKPRDIERRWYVVDADGVVLGRLASEVAQILRGKHKPIYAPHADTGDHVIVVNASGVRLTGGKEFRKIAYRHSGYPGGLRETSYERLLADRPAFAVEKAIRGMLPKNSLGRAMGRKLSVYAGPEHRHQAQKPVPLTLGEVPKWDGLPAPTAEAPKPAPEPARKPRSVRSPKAGDEASTKGRTTKRSTAKAATAKAAAKPDTKAAKATAAKPAAAPKKKAPAEGEAKPARTRSKQPKESPESEES